MRYVLHDLSSAYDKYHGFKNFKFILGCNISLSPFLSLWQPDSNTFLIESLGPTSIEESCFMNNLVQGAGVAVYGNQLVSSNVHAVGSGGTLCEFASVFESLQQFESLQPLCIAAQMANCTMLDLPTSNGENVTLLKHYIPFATNSLDYDVAFESDSTFEGGCNRLGNLPVDGPDAQNTEDQVCLELGGCHISHSLPGEYLIYRFGHYSGENEVNGLLYVDVTVRVSSVTSKQFTLQLLYNNDTEVAALQTLGTVGGSYDSYEDITWSNVPLRGSESIHSIKFIFTDGLINFCSISVQYSNQGMLNTSMPALATGSPVAAPTTTTSMPALATGSPIVAPATATSMPALATGSPVAAPATATSVPALATGSPVAAPATATSVPALATGSPVVAPSSINTTLPPTFPPYPIVTTAPSSAPIEIASPSSMAPNTTAKYEVLVPGEYSAMYFTEESVLDMEDGQLGDCRVRPESFVDAQINDDAICAQAQNEFGTTCNIAYTEDGEYVVYSFRKDPSQSSVSVTLRTASIKTRQLQVDILSHDESVQIATYDGGNPSTGSSDTYNSITIWDQVDIGTEEYYKLKVTFPDGGVNLCSFAIE